MGSRKDYPTRFAQLRPLSEESAWHYSPLFKILLSQPCGHYFPLLESRAELLVLFRLMEAAVTPELANGRKRLERFIREKVSRAERRLRKIILRKRGRPRDHRKHGIWERAAALRHGDPRKWSWNKLAQELDPAGYKENPSAARERMRKGVRKVRHRK